MIPGCTAKAEGEVKGEGCRLRAKIKSSCGIALDPADVSHANNQWAQQVFCSMSWKSLAQFTQRGHDELEASPRSCFRTHTPGLRVSSTTKSPLNAFSTTSSKIGGHYSNRLIAICQIQLHLVCEHCCSCVPTLKILREPRVRKLRP